MKVEHTLGPWEAKPMLTVQGKFSGGYKILHCGRVIANVQEADARLIAATPDLLDCTKLLLQICLDYKRVSKKTGKEFLPGAWAQHYVQVRRAIEKATGETHHE